MTATDLSAAVLERLTNKAPLEQLIAVVTTFKVAGGSQDEALRCLNATRLMVAAADEDRLLELLDCVAGWCGPALRIWD